MTDKNDTITFRVGESNEQTAKLMNLYHDYIISVQTDTITGERSYMLLVDDEPILTSQYLGLILDAIENDDEIRG